MSNGHGEDTILGKRRSSSSKGVGVDTADSTRESGDGVDGRGGTETSGTDGLGAREGSDVEGGGRGRGRL